MSFGERFLHYPDLFPARPSGEPWGEEQIVIQFAGHVYRVMGLSEVQAQGLRRRFGELCLSSDETLPSTAVKIQVFRAVFEDFDDQGLVWLFDFELDYAQDALRVAGFHMMGRLDWMPELQGTLWTPEEERLVSHAIFENFFRMVVAYHLFDQDGILLHSAAVVNQGRAYMFFGPSGAGKSTISRLSAAQGYAVLSDDMNALRTTHEGVMVEKLPFAGDFGHSGDGAEGAYPLKTLCRLQKGLDPILEPLRPAAAVADLMGCAPFINRNPYYRERLLDSLQALQSCLSVSKLTFALDHRFWALLESEND